MFFASFLNRIVGSFEDVRLARIEFAFNTLDDPVARIGPHLTLERRDHNALKPSVLHTASITTGFFLNFGIFFSSPSGAKDSNYEITFVLCCITPTLVINENNACNLEKKPS